MEHLKMEPCFTADLFPKYRGTCSVCANDLYCREVKWAGKRKEAFYYTKNGKRHYKHRCNLRSDENVKFEGS